MARKKYTAEQIITKLREAKIELAKVQTTRLLERHGFGQDDRTCTCPAQSVSVLQLARVANPRGAA